MKYVLTNEQMRAADSGTIKGGVPSLTLMERAGEALANEAISLADGWKKGGALCVCGGGNNGGDGFVCARLLRARGVAVKVVCASEKKSTDCAENAARWLALGEGIYDKIPNGEYAVVVDCLFGTGFHGSLTGEALALVKEINSLREGGAKVLAADIPSGVNGNSGRVLGEGVVADRTLCIGEYKAGVFLQDGADYCGEVKRADIGIVLPKEEYAVLSDRELVFAFLPKRKRNAHKGSFGRAAIVAGSEKYTGAAYLSAAGCAEACLRAGVGYTALYLPKSILPYYLLKLPEVLLCASNEGGRYEFNEEKMQELLVHDGIAFGMGMGVSKEVACGAKWLIENYEGRLVLDADGLNSLAAYEELSAAFANKKCDVVLTPHAKEFARLTGESVDSVLTDGLALAQTFAKKHGVTLLLKGATTVITDGRRTAFNTAGNSGQAKGGSGDVLSGLIVGLCASGACAYEGAVVGAYLAGTAAVLAAKELGEYALTPTDCIAKIGRAFLFVTENTDKDGGEE